MRPAVCVAVCVAMCACSEPDTRVQPAVVQWMEWPAEVLSNTQFKVRLVVWQSGCGFGAFRPGVSADQSAVTFSPFFLIDKKNAICLPEVRVVDIAIGALDTAGTAPGLAADFARTFEMRGTGEVYVANASNAAGTPVRTFGDVIVRPSAPDQSRRNAAGIIFASLDTLGCVRVRPWGLFSPGSDIVLENPTDTAGIGGSFVHGYIHQPAAPVCGETSVFHLVSRN